MPRFGSSCRSTTISLMMSLSIGFSPGPWRQPDRGDTTFRCSTGRGTNAGLTDLMSSSPSQCQETMPAALIRDGKVRKDECERRFSREVPSLFPRSMPRGGIYLWRTTGGIYPVSDADLGGPGSNADQFLLNDFLPSDFLPTDAFAGVRLTARRYHSRYETRRGSGQFDLRNHAGRVDQIPHAHTGGNRCFGRLRRGQNHHGPFVTASPQGLDIAPHAVLIVHEHLIALGLGAGELGVAAFAALVAGQRHLELLFGAAAPQLEPLPE